MIIRNTPRFHHRRRMEKRRSGCRRHHRPKKPAGKRHHRRFGKTAKQEKRKNNCHRHSRQCQPYQMGKRRTVVSQPHDDNRCRKSRPAEKIHPKRFERIIYSHTGFRIADKKKKEQTLVISQKVYIYKRLLETTNPNMAERKRNRTKKKKFLLSRTSRCSF